MPRGGIEKEVQSGQSGEQAAESSCGAGEEEMEEGVQAAGTVGRSHDSPSEVRLLLPPPHQGEEWGSEARALCGEEGEKACSMAHGQERGTAGLGWVGLGLP